MEALWRGSFLKINSPIPTPQSICNDHESPKWYAHEGDGWRYHDILAHIFEGQLCDNFYFELHQLHINFIWVLHPTTTKHYIHKPSTCVSIFVSTRSGSHHSADHFPLHGLFVVCCGRSEHFRIHLGESLGLRFAGGGCAVLGCIALGLITVSWRANSIGNGSGFFPNFNESGRTGDAMHGICT